MVTLAKALGNGVPIGRAGRGPRWPTCSSPGHHATTYGGQPLATAAARAVLAVMEAERLLARATWAGATLTAALERLPAVAEVRGLGLLVAAELVPGIDARRVAADALAKGLVVNAVTPSAVLRLAPSLLVTDEEIVRALGVLAAALDAVVETTPGLEAAP